MDYILINVRTILFTLICFSACASVGISPRDTNIETKVNNINLTNSSHTQDSEIQDLIALLNTTDDVKRKEVENRLRKIANENTENKSRVVRKLISETKKICKAKSGVIESQGLFKKTVSMSAILASFQSMEALETLIECSDFTLPVHTQAKNNFATFEAVVLYGKQALPKLKEKIQDKGPSLKCSISNILTEIGAGEAEKILIEAQKKETNEEALICFRNSLNYFDVIKEK